MWPRGSGPGNRSCESHTPTLLIQMVLWEFTCLANFGSAIALVRVLSEAQ